MYFFTTVAAALALAMPGTLAADAAATKNYPITTGCSQFPAYSPGSDVTGTFLLQFVQSKAPINGNSVTYFNYFDDDKGRFVITVAVDLAKIPVRCNQANASSNGGAPFFESLHDGGQWLPLQIFAPATGFNPNADNAQMVFGAVSNMSQLVRAYSHDPNASNGIFLGGADSSTKWATEVEFISDDVHRSFYSLRYVPTGGRVRNAEYSGFLKVWAV